MPTRTYYDEDIRVQMRIPDDWEAASSPQFSLILFAPMQQEFRANMSFSIRALNPPTPENLLNLITTTRADRKTSYDRFHLLDEERIMQDGFPGHLEIYRFLDDETHIPLTQLFAMILTGPEALYGIHATALEMLERDYLPVFRGIIESLRFGQAAE